MRGPGYISTPTTPFAAVSFDVLFLCVLLVGASDVPTRRGRRIHLVARLSDSGRTVGPADYHTPRGPLRGSSGRRCTYLLPVESRGPGPNHLPTAGSRGPNAPRSDWEGPAHPAPRGEQSVQSSRFCPLRQICRQTTCSAVSCLSFFVDSLFRGSLTRGDCQEINLREDFPINRSVGWEVWLGYNSKTPRYVRRLKGVPPKEVRAFSQNSTLALVNRTSRRRTPIPSRAGSTSTRTTGHN